VEIPAGLTVDEVLSQPDGTAWMAVHRAAERDPGDGRPPAQGGLGRWDGHRLTLLPVPRGFRVSALLAAGGKEVWMLGPGRAVYQWDGQRLRAGKLAFGATASMGSAEAGVWIGGALDGKSRVAHVPPLREGR
jgi:hypothetical protein